MVPLSQALGPMCGCVSEWRFPQLNWPRFAIFRELICLRHVVLSDTVSQAFTTSQRSSARPPSRTPAPNHRAAASGRPVYAARFQRQRRPDHSASRGASGKLIWYASLTIQSRGTGPRCGPVPLSQALAPQEQYAHSTNNQFKPSINVLRGGLRLRLLATYARRSRYFWARVQRLNRKERICCLLQRWEM